MRSSQVWRVLDALLVDVRRRPDASRSRPASLASYMAMSALTSSSAGLERVCASKVVMPMLTLSRSWWPLSMGKRRSRISSSSPRAMISDPVGRHIAQQHRELVTAQTRDHVGGAQPLPQHVSRPVEDRVADGVAVAVVDVLEVVEVDHQQRRWTAVVDSVVRVDLAFELALEVTPVRHPGERVGRGQVLAVAARAAQALARAAERDRGAGDLVLHGVEAVGHGAELVGGVHHDALACRPGRVRPRGRRTRGSPWLR